MTLARKFLRKQSKKRRNQPLPDNYPQTLRQQPDNVTRTFPISQEKKERRAIFTIDTIRKILHWYGSIPNFLHALDELQSFTLKENRKKKFDFDFPKDLADLKVTKDSVLKDLKKQIRPHCGTLVTLGRLSKSQFTLLSRFIPQLPCYKTVRRDKKKQRNIAAEADEDFFLGLEEGLRSFCQKKPNGAYYISMKNMLRWILYLVSDVMEDNFKEYSKITMDFKFALWADGGKMYGGIKGLFSALKMVYPIFRDSLGEIINVKHEHIKWLIGTAWMMSIDNTGETSEGVRSLEKFQMEEYLEHVKDKTFNYGKFSLRASLVGWCTDHGYRIKSLKQDSRKKCCGECNFSKQSKIKGKTTHFLDQQYLLPLEEVNSKNWYSIRSEEMPSYIKLVAEAEMSLLSYDNHHNMVGHIKKQYSILHAKATTLKKQDIVNQRSFDLVGIDSAVLEKPNKKDKLRRKWPYQGWQWRLLSLHFKEIFKDVFEENFEKQLFVMFDLLNEIHLVNYMHFDRNAKDFNLLIERYWIIITCYGIQLDLLYKGTEYEESIDDVYLHKIMVHSPRIFMKYNLAMYSCEQGEGSISISNRVSKANGNCNNKNETILRVLDYHILTQEKMCFVSDTPSSRVWKRAEIDLFRYKVDYANCPTVKCMIISLVKQTQPYLKDFKSSRHLGNIVNSNVESAAFNPFVVYSSQLDHLPETLNIPANLSKFSHNISMNNDVTVPAGKPIPVTPAPILKYNNEHRIYTNHTNRLKKLEQDLKSQEQKFTEMVSVYNELERRTNNLADEFALLNIKDEQFDTYTFETIPHVYDFLNQFREEIEARTSKGKDFDAKWLPCKEYFEKNQQIFTKLIAIEKRSVELLSEIPNLGGSDNDKFLEFYFSKVVPYINIYSDLFDKTVCILHALKETLYLVPWKKNLIDKKYVSLCQAYTEAQVFLAKQKEITAASRNSNEEIDGINTNTIDYNDETLLIDDPMVTTSIDIVLTDRITGRKRLRQTIPNQRKKRKS